MTGAIVGILLAAGRGSRFGSDKLMHPMRNGIPMAVTAAANLLPACDRVIAVLRPGSDRLAQLLSLIGCETVICRTANAGMGHSLAAGVNASRDAAGWIVALADMPFISPASHRRVVHALRNGATLAACGFDGLRGHPVGFAAHWCEQLAALGGDEGAKGLLQQYRHELLLCPVDDPGVLWDIDRPEDL